MKHLLFPLAAVMALAAVPAEAQEGKAPATFEECAAIPDDDERLACYDEIARARVPDTVEAMEEAREEEKKKKFGLIEPEAKDELKRLHVTFRLVKRNLERKLVFETEDGQVWVQNDTKRAFYPEVATGTIRKGLLGAYFFIPDANLRPLKVKRVK